MDKNTEAYRSREYEDFFDAAELDNLAEEDFVAYSQSYAKMEETERALENHQSIKSMEITSHFNHVNFNVTDLERSMKFYKEALGLEKTGEILHPDGDFRIVYLSRPGESFRLELTWLRDHPQAYELGENESHLAMRVEGDYDAIREYHRAMGCICYENESMGLYFIHDPDDYWIEILK